MRPLLPSPLSLLAQEPRHPPRPPRAGRAGASVRHLDLTVDEYRNASRMKRLVYRVFATLLSLCHRSADPISSFAALCPAPAGQMETFPTKRASSGLVDEYRAVACTGPWAAADRLAGGAADSVAHHNHLLQRGDVYVLRVNTSLSAPGQGTHAGGGTHPDRYARQFLLSIAPHSPVVHRQYRFPPHPSPQPPHPQLPVASLSRREPDPARVMHLTIGKEPANDVSGAVGGEAQRRLISFAKPGDDRFCVSGGQTVPSAPGWKSAPLTCAAFRRYGQKADPHPLER